MTAAINAMNFPDSSTNTAGGLDRLRVDIFSRNNGDRPDVRNVVIVLTDGVPTVNPELTIPNAEALRSEDNALVFVIGVTESVNKTILRQISSPPQIENQNWFATEDFETLNNLIKDIATQACATPPPPQVG